MPHTPETTSIEVSDSELRVIMAMRHSDRMGNAIYKYAKGFDPESFSGIVNRQRYDDYHPPHYSDSPDL
jgi:hypothetical protein